MDQFSHSLYDFARCLPCRSTEVAASADVANTPFGSQGCATDRNMQFLWFRTARQRFNLQYWANLQFTWFRDFSSTRLLQDIPALNQNFS